MPFILANMLLQSRGLSMSSATGSILHSCSNPLASKAISNMCSMENMLICVRMSFLSRALELPLLQLKSFLVQNSEHRQMPDDPFVWLARDVTITRVQTSFFSICSTWKGIVVAASAAKTVCCLWREQWRLLWQKSGMTAQLHGITGIPNASSATVQAACDFEQKFLNWASASCRSLWQTAVSYGACLKMVELALECVCCMMEAPVLQKTVYGRIGGERLLEVVCPHRRHLKILQLWMQVRSSRFSASPRAQRCAGHLQTRAVDPADVVGGERCSAGAARQHPAGLHRDHRHSFSGFAACDQSAAWCRLVSVFECLP